MMSKGTMSNLKVFVLAVCLGIVATFPKEVAKAPDDGKEKSSKAAKTDGISKANAETVLSNRESRAVFRFPNNFKAQSKEQIPDITMQKFPFEPNQFWIIPQTRPGRSSDMIPMIRFGRSESMIPSVRFGRSESMIPSVRFGRAPDEEHLNENVGNIIPNVRFGRSDSLIPSLRFGKSADDQVYGKTNEVNRMKRSSVVSSETMSKRGSGMIPTIRFGRSDSLIPSLRFGRSDSLIPSLRFGRSDALIPSLRFGRSFQKKDNGMIPVLRFGRSSDSMIPSIRFGRNMDTSEQSLGISSPYFSVSETKIDESQDLDGTVENESAEEGELHYKSKRHPEDSMDMIPYPRLGRESESEERNETNDSLIPQIRYGKSLQNEKAPKEAKSPHFLLPNIRPGRSYKQVILSKSDYPQVMLPYPRPGRSDARTDSTYYNTIDDFLSTVYGVFRRSGEHHPVNGKGLSNLVQAYQSTTIPAANEENVTAEDEEEEGNTSMFIIPYPRPGKRNLLNLVKSDQQLLKSKSEDNKNSNYIVPYPRPGKRSFVEINESGELLSTVYDDMQYDANNKFKRAVNMIPLPRPGRSTSISVKGETLAPQPRLGRSDVMVPYPRPGRSGNIIPFPRPGRSNYMIPFLRPGRS